MPDKKTNKKSNCGHCGEPRDIKLLDFMCGTCNHWFHSQCITPYSGKFVQFMVNYNFYCKRCSSTGSDFLQKKCGTYVNMCVTALANLTTIHKKESFCVQEEIIAYMEEHWEGMTTMPRRTKTTWHSTVYKSLSKESNLFVCCSKDVYSLRNKDVMRVRPLYETLAGVGKPESQGRGGGRMGKKRGLSTIADGGSSKRSRGEAPTDKLPTHGYPLDHPFNKREFQYILADVDPHAPYRREWDESADWAGRPIPGYLHRAAMPTHVLLALHDRAAQLKISADRLRVTGEKGYSLVRASHHVKQGQWYFEMKVTNQPAGSHVRAGWARLQSDTQMPLGVDKFGYSWRSRRGTVFHQARGRSYMPGMQGFGQGDVLGFYISLPCPRKTTLRLPDAHKNRALIKFKHYYYYEVPIERKQPEQDTTVAKNSEIKFYKNGKCCGVAFCDIFEGEYFPSISLYKDMTVECNFGPKFKYPPKNIPYKPMSERACEQAIEQTMADIMYHVINQKKIRELAKSFC